MNISEILLYLPTIMLACALIISSVVAIAMLPWSTKDFQRGKHEAQYVNSQLKIWVNKIWTKNTWAKKTWTKEVVARFLDLKNSNHTKISSSFSSPNFTTGSFTKEITEEITGIRRRRAV